MWLIQVLNYQRSYNYYYCTEKDGDMDKKIDCEPEFLNKKIDDNNACMVGNCH